MSDVTFKFHIYTDWKGYGALVDKWKCGFTVYIGRLGVSTHITKEYKENACEAFCDGIEQAMKITKAFQEASIVPINFTYEAGF